LNLDQVGSIISKGIYSNLAENLESVFLDKQRMKGYAYFKNTLQFESIIVQDRNTGIVNAFQFPHKNASIIFSPDYHYAIAWT